jgi:malate dehydrogenase
MAKAILESKGVYDKKKLLGVTTLDLVRAQTFVAENQGAHHYNRPIIYG